MVRRLFLGVLAAAAFAGCNSSTPVAEPQKPAENPPPAGAELVSLKLPGMT